MPDARTARGTDAPPLIAPDVTTGATAAAPDDDEADSDGIPKGVLPFPISARSAERSHPRVIDPSGPAAWPDREAEAG
jgi:hypothetical protein